MPLVSLRLADFQNSSRDHLVLADKIPLSAIDFRKLETLHVCITENGKTLVDGSRGFGYSHEGGVLQAVHAVASEGESQSVLEVSVAGRTLGTFALRDKESQAVLTDWKKEIDPGSVISVRQISTLSQAKKIDIFLVVLNAGILP
jgi:hypothetical protein